VGVAVRPKLKMIPRLIDRATQLYTKGQSLAVIGSSQRQLADAANPRQFSVGRPRSWT